MSAVEYLLDGLERHLELERELGTRTVEFDRSLLSSAAAVKPAQPPSPPRPTEKSDGAEYDFAFLVDRRLSDGAVAMMAKIVTAMGKTAESAPIVFLGDRPKAKAYVVLGSLALRKWFPGVAGAPGQWVAAEGVKNILVTYSPEYILRFGTVTPAVKKIKMDMWTSLKGVMARV